MDSLSRRRLENPWLMLEWTRMKSRENWSPLSSWACWDRGQLFLHLNRLILDRTERVTVALSVYVCELIAAWEVVSAYFAVLVFFLVICEFLVIEWLRHASCWGFLGFPILLTVLWSSASLCSSHASKKNTSIALFISTGGENTLVMLAMMAPKERDEHKSKYDRVSWHKKAGV